MCFLCLLSLLMVFGVRLRSVGCPFAKSCGKGREDLLFGLNVVSLHGKTLRSYAEKYHT